MDALLRLREEVTVERWDARGGEVVTSAPYRRGERLTLEVAGNGHRPLGVVVRDSRVSVIPGELISYRVLLAIDPAGGREGSER